MDFQGRKYERGSNWSEPEVVELLQMWSDEAVQSELEGCLRNQHVFKRIATALHGRGVYRTGEQCREKIKKLKLEYRRARERRHRAWRFYEVMDRVLSGRSGQQQQRVSTQPLSSPQTPPLRPDQQLRGIKHEEVHTEERATPELLHHAGSAYEHAHAHAHDAESRSPGQRGDVAHAGSSSGFSDHNMADFSGTGVSPTTDSMVITDGAVHGDVDDPKRTGSFHQKKRRRAGRGSGGGRLLERALADFLGWQQAMEERYLSLEEARLQQEARAEERREQQEERRTQQNREHELRLLSLFTGALAAARGTMDSTCVSSCNLGLVPAASTAASEPAHPPVNTSSPTPVEEPSIGPSTAPFTPSLLRIDQKPQYNHYLSRRGNDLQQHQGILQDGYRQYHSNKHDEDTNPDGIINMGTSENKLCFDLLQERLTCADMLHIEPSLLQYPDWKGHHFLREEVANFLSEHCRSPSPLKTENVVVMNGCGSVFCALAAVLCDPDDAILIPTPFYGMITEDVGLYSGVKLYCVPLGSEASENDGRPFHLTAEKLEGALEKAKKEGVNVRAVILVNPHNPLGEIYTAEEMTSFLNFAKRHELHAIVDEVYMLSVFNEDHSFHSVLSLERIPDAQRTHVLWGISKDFALAGVRVGTLYSENRDLVQALDQLCAFHGISGPTQHQLAQLLRDKEWMNSEFLPENRRRLKEAHQYVANQLTGLGIPYLHRGAGFFIWADFSKYLKKHTFTEELEVWRCFLKHRVLLSCGQAFSCCSPGWFRIIFSDQQRHLQLGLERIKEALEELQASSILPDSENAKKDKKESHRQTESNTKAEDKSHEGSSKEMTISASSTLTKMLCEENSTEAERSLLADKDIVVLHSQSSSTAENLDSLIGALRQQIHSSDWLEKNRPELAAGEDLTQLDVFKDLLDRVRI